MKNKLLVFFLLLLPFISRAQVGVQPMGAPNVINKAKGGLDADSSLRVPGIFPTSWTWTDSCRRMWMTGGNVYFHDCTGRIQVLSMKDTAFIKSLIASGGSVMWSNITGKPTVFPPDTTIAATQSDLLQSLTPIDANLQHINNDTAKWNTSATAITSIDANLQNINNDTAKWNSALQVETDPVFRADSGKIMHQRDTVTKYSTPTSVLGQVVAYVSSVFNGLFDGRLSTKTTDNLTEGSTNKYYTDARVQTVIGGDTTANKLSTPTSVNSQIGSAGALKVNYSDSVFKYVTPTSFTGLFNTQFATKSTTNLTEGSNLYYTDARVQTVIGGDTAANKLSTPTSVSGQLSAYIAANFNTLFDTRFGTKTTTNLAEGSNLYYTDARVQTVVGGDTTANKLSTPTSTLSQILANPQKNLVNRVANVVDFGADSTGTNDCKFSIAAAIATGKPVFFPNGRYRIDTSLVGSIMIQLRDSQTMFSLGQAYITTTSNATMVANSNYGQVQNIKFIGSGKRNFTVPQQTGVVVNTKTHSRIMDCDFFGIAGTTKRIVNGTPSGAIVFMNTLDTSHVYTHNYISGNQIHYSNIGINYTEKITYNTFIGNDVDSCLVALMVSGSNYKFEGNDFAYNDTGLIMKWSVAYGHGDYTGNTFNHCHVGYWLDSVATSYAETFTGDLFLTVDRNIMTNCANIFFSNCQWAVTDTNYYSNNNTVNVVSGWYRAYDSLTTGFAYNELPSMIGGAYINSPISGGLVAIRSGNSPANNPYRALIDTHLITTTDKTYIFQNLAPLTNIIGNVTGAANIALSGTTVWSTGYSAGNITYTPVNICAHCMLGNHTAGSSGATVAILTTGDIPVIPLSTGVSGTLPAAQFPALTGDVTTSAGAVATTIAANAVSNSKLAQMAANTIKLNNTGSTASAIDGSIAQLNTMLGFGTLQFGTSTFSGNAVATTFTVTVPSGVQAYSCVSNTPGTAIVTGANVSGTTLTITCAAAPVLGTNNVIISYTLK